MSSERPRRYIPDQTGGENPPLTPKTSRHMNPVELPAGHPPPIPPSSWTTNLLASSHPDSDAKARKASGQQIGQGLGSVRHAGRTFPYRWNGRGVLVLDRPGREYLSIIDPQPTPVEISPIGTSTGDWAKSTLDPDEQTKRAVLAQKRSLEDVVRAGVSLVLLDGGNASWLTGRGHPSAGPDPPDCARPLTRGNRC